MHRRHFVQTLTGLTAVAALPGLSSFRIAAAGEPAGQSAAKANRPIPRFGDGRDWFFEKRFGLFVHWGLYAIAGWHEQHQWRGRVPREEYVQLAQQWNPVKYDPDAWLDLAQAAGMKYICITTKHHDGFCLWNTQQTNYNTMHTPYGKDVIKMLADACHRRRFPLCLNYSIADWHQPYYPNLGRHHELPPQSTCPACGCASCR
jgi:alpha-L-fucosidase